MSLRKTKMRNVTLTVIALLWMVASSCAGTPDEAYEKGVAYSRQGNYDQALIEFNNAFDGSPKDAYTFGGRGNVYLCKGNFDQAIADCTKAVELMPEYGSGYQYRAYAYLATAEYTKAWSDVRRAEALGIIIDPVFLDGLKKVSGKDR